VGKNFLVHGRIKVTGKGTIYMGDNVEIEQNVYLHVEQGATLTLGNHVFINEEVMLVARSSI
jgi:carbonic anhydrase/acetyltransferase-like protein (isoleucine patch superfamily)